MNLNYIGSVAERFMQFRSTLATEENVTSNLFNAISIYVPKSLAAANLASGSYDPDEITEDKYAVIPVTVDNYNTVLSQSGNLMTDWLPVFNDGTNFSVTLYIIIFDDTDFQPTLSAKGIVWEPLTKAFKELYFISFFKTMFAEDYSEVSDNYFDMALALSYQCELESTLSFCLLEVKAEVPGSTDTNDCKVMSHTRAAEVTNCKTFVSTGKIDRASYFWGFLNLLGFAHTNLIVHNGSFMTPIVLGKWFEAKNSSGEFVGNKLAKIRLSGNKVKPTGLPSPLNSDVNLNLPASIYEILDSKNVGYFISIADGSDNNAELIRDRSGSNMPITAYMISKWIDYNASQALAKYATRVETLTEPVLANEETYAYIQRLVTQTVSTFSSTNRIRDINVSFPPYAEAKKGNSFEGVAVWSAVYVDDLEGVRISGSVNF